MLKFLEEAVEILRETKKPTKDEVVNMTIAVFVVIVIFGIFFVFVDGLFINIYNYFYDIMKSVVW